MPSAPTTRQELAAFLRTRRRQAARERYDLPPLPRSANPGVGLRREEVATLAGVSITWYTWLEQARDVNPSRQVLTALARTFFLSDAETAYLLQLAGYSPEPAAMGEQVADPSLAMLQQFLDAQVPSPAFVLRADWEVVAWNQAYELLYPGVISADNSHRNLLRAIFTDPAVRTLLPDWPTTSGQFLAEFRAGHPAMLNDPAVRDLVAELREMSPEFAQAWQSHEVAHFPSGQREFLHPVAGELIFHQYQLIPTDHPQMRMVVYLALPGSRTWEQLSTLLGSVAN